MSDATPTPERPVEPVRGTRDWMPGQFLRLASLEDTLIERFTRAGYVPMRTPILEPTELHERKSGAGIVAKLFELSDDSGGRVCLRPELTAGIVRAYVDAPEPPPLPWRVSHAGSVFRHEDSVRKDRLREFQQVGVELIGTCGAAADGELIWLASWALEQAGIGDATIRIGHVGLILEMLRRSGLPGPSQASLVEMLSDAAADGRNVRSLEHGLGQLSGWLDADRRETEGAAPPPEGDDDRSADRLFRMLVPAVIGRRSGHEVMRRLRRKWELGHTLAGTLDEVRARARDLAELKGPPAVVLERLDRDYADSAPESIAALRALVEVLGDYGIEPGRIELDMGFGRGIGFYSRMVFELLAPTPAGPVEVCGGGRYDGLARVLGSGRDDRGAGFAFGMERLLATLEARGASASDAPGPLGCVVAGSVDFARQAIRLATHLRTSGMCMVVAADRPYPEWAEDPDPRVSWCVIVRGDPARAGSLALRSMGGKAESRTTIEELTRLAAAQNGAA